MNIKKEDKNITSRKFKINIIKNSHIKNVLKRKYFCNIRIFKIFSTVALLILKVFYIYII